MISKSCHEIGIWVWLGWVVLAQGLSECCNQNIAKTGGLPGGPVAKTLRSHCSRPGFDPWSGNKIPHAAIKIKNLCVTIKMWRGQIIAKDIKNSNIARAEVR